VCIGSFEQQNLNASYQFEVFAGGLVCTFVLTTTRYCFTSSVKYNIGSVDGPFFDGDRLRELRDPIPCQDEIIPDPDLVPLSILNYPLGKELKVDFAAYDPPEVTLSPMEGAHPVLVLHLDSRSKFDQGIGLEYITDFYTAMERSRAL
jgi:hypothetical protein